MSDEGLISGVVSKGFAREKFMKLKALDLSVMSKLAKTAFLASIQKNKKQDKDKSIYIACRYWFADIDQLIHHVLDEIVFYYQKTIISATEILLVLNISE